MKHNEPDRSKGGTFIRDKDGKLISHIPPTALKPPPAPAGEGDESKQADAKAAARTKAKE